MKLTDVPEQAECTVTSVSRSDEDIFCRLLSMGILPGAKVKLLQKKPLPICEVKGCKLALDCILAEKVNVK